MIESYGRPNSIGARWQDVLRRVEECLEDEDRLRPRELEFLQDVRDRLQEYKGRTYFSQPQFDWLAKIEESLEQEPEHRGWGGQT